MKHLLNNDWKFMHGDFPEAMAPAFDDAAWYDTGLPHSFGTPYFLENHFYVGYGCYRKRFTVPYAWAGKRIGLEFQGAFQDAAVYVNGLLAGTHQGGYTAFFIDVTAHVVPGENLLAVRLNNRWNPQLAPRGGEHVFNGGLYRDVSLVVTDPVHLGWYGTGVTTPTVSEGEALVAIDTEIVNETDAPVRCTVEAVVSREGHPLFRTQAVLTVAAGETAAPHLSGTVAHPALWCPESPQMYDLVCRLSTDAGHEDGQVVPFGIRWFSFGATEGFFLNGKPYDILGANVHQDHAGWSDAVTHAGIRRDVKLIKDCGMNFIRGSHYPHHTVFADECDRQGLLFWSELCYWGTGGPKKEGYWHASAYPIHGEDMAPFEAHCMQTLREMIRTNRNHPSLIVWSMSNEPFFSCDEVMEPARELIRKLVALSHDLDPTRPAAVGGCQRGGFDVLGDLAGYNGDGAVLYMDPGFPNFVSEYGSVIADRPGAYDPGYTDGVENRHAWRSGKALWCAFHHGSIFSDMGHMGMIDYHRLPLRAWYRYRHDLLGIAPPQWPEPGEPHAVRLEADRTVMRADGTEDVQLIVTLLGRDGNRIAHAIPVTLEVLEGGGVFPTGRRIVLTPENGGFLDGQGAIEMRSWHAGDIVVRAYAEGVAGDRIHIRAVEGPAWTGQPLRLPAPPPSVLVPTQGDESYDLARSRPVFCSSFAPGHAAGCTTDGADTTWWLPDRAEAVGAWVMIDLEGNKRIEGVEIVLGGEATQHGEMPAVPVLSGSTDGLRFEPLRLSASSLADHLVATDHLVPTGEDRRFRYLRAAFPEKARPVIHFRIWAR